MDRIENPLLLLSLAARVSPTKQVEVFLRCYESTAHLVRFVHSRGCQLMLVMWTWTRTHTGVSFPRIKRREIGCCFVKLSGQGVQVEEQHCGTSYVE